MRKIYVVGHNGMVGSAIVRALKNPEPPTSALPNISLITSTRAELDFTNQVAVNAFFAQEKPDQVYLAAAKVGGIHANNTYPAEFIYENLMVQANAIHAAFRNGVKKLLFLGSSCVVSTPGLRRSPCAKTPCSPARWSPPMSPTPLPKSPA